MPSAPSRATWPEGSPGRNALDVLFDEARRQGSAVQYVIYYGGMFVKPAADLSGIDLMDPKMVNNVPAMRSTAKKAT